MEKQLLTIFLELYSYDREIKTWSVEEFADNPPRLYRLEMITALLKALNINCSYAEFLKGEFITEENLPDSVEILALTSKIYPDDLGIKPRDKWSVRIAKYVFESLMKYRLKFEELFDIGGGVLAASGYYRIPSLVNFGINKKMKKECAKLEALLLLFLNPENIQYSKEELIAKFNYPDVDLESIDIEWM